MVKCLFFFRKKGRGDSIPFFTNLLVKYYDLAKLNLFIKTFSNCRLARIDCFNKQIFFALSKKKGKEVINGC